MVLNCRHIKIDVSRIGRASRQPCPSDIYSTACASSHVIEHTRGRIEVCRLTPGAAIDHGQVYASLLVDLLVKSGHLSSVVSSTEQWSDSPGRADLAATKRISIGV